MSPATCRAGGRVDKPQTSSGRQWSLQLTQCRGSVHKYCWSEYEEKKTKNLRFYSWKWSSLPRQWQWTSGEIVCICRSETCTMMQFSTKWGFFHRDCNRCHMRWSWSLFLCPRYLNIWKPHLRNKVCGAHKASWFWIPALIGIFIIIRDVS